MRKLTNWSSANKYLVYFRFDKPTVAHCAPAGQTYMYIHTYIYKQITSKSVTVDATDVATESASESAMLFLRVAHTATTAEAVRRVSERERE